MPLHTPSPGGCTCAAGRRCSSPGKHPRLPHGLHEASTDPAQIRRWWARWPHANIGLATGGVLDVCDIDTPEALRRVLDLLDVVKPPGPLVRTGHGWHLWYASSGLPSRIGVLPGMDWRGKGGLVVAPPSLHATGDWYTFTQPLTGTPLPPVPDVLCRLVTPPASPLAQGEPSVEEPVSDLGRYGQAALTGEINRIHAAPRPFYSGGQRVSGGGRNDALVKAAFRLGQLAAAGGLDEHVVWPQLAAAATSVGLPTAEARRTIASGWRAGVRHPRIPVRRVHRLRR
ncbi:Bifunctional DNA primase/polymerase, N-terminal [Actinoplanes regularis]|uniref:Bifunctional DNA primase/polymerase, N-terminal n=2 Tax=Actinoplanes regularis TaxID=52697 RepID=A0A238XJB6_9ACTN|nr:Bifunctional DNA primase/polymerase, N-terminal [Actinoplanes regularis]